MKTQMHRTIEIDPAEFADRVPKDMDSDEHYFDEGDVLKFLIDQMNDVKINIAMIRHEHEYAIEYRGRRNHFSTSISLLDHPADAVIEGMVEISHILNDPEVIESWVSYKYGKHALHILRKAEISEAEDTLEQGAE